MNNQQGLSFTDVQKRISEGKVNTQPKKQTKTNFEIIKSNLFTLFNLFNFIIAIALFSVKAYSNMFFILIILLNLTIGILQEIHARNLIDKLSILSETKARALRDGQINNIPIDEIVIDDIIKLKMGDQIPSDAIIIEGSIEVNESILTGESDNIFKKIGDDVLAGSFVVSGTCYIKITKVGEDNFVSKIISEVKKEKGIKSELISSMRKITKFTSFFIIPIGAILFIQAFIFRSETIDLAIIDTSAALLGMLPKGLVLLITICLATSVIKLSKKQVLVQDLYSVESLAHIDTICLDKTGTITKGTMSVSNIYAFDQSYNHDIDKILCNYINAMDDNNATFMAIQKYYSEQQLTNYNICNKIPFSSERKWSSLEFEGIGTFVLGAFEKIQSRSTTTHTPDSIINAQKDGKRILCLGYSQDKVVNFQLPEMHIIGIIELEDPIRENATSMVEMFKKEGVEVKIISGDNPITVSGIAHKIGLENPEKYIDMSTIADDTNYNDLAEDYKIFGRVSPNQKSYLVKALQQNNHKVAMTGDGVNDVMALREADCSITVAEASDAAKQVSKIVLLNSDFGILSDALMEGRRSVNNVTKVASIFFIKTIYTILLSLINIFTNTSFIFIPIQITLLDLVLEGYTSFFLSFEPNSTPVKPKFLKTVLTNAMPYALTIIIALSTFLLIGNKLPLTATELDSTMYYTIAGITIFAVIKACLPLNPLRAFLAITTPCGFLLATFLFHKLLKIQRFNMPILIVFIITIIISFIIKTLLEKLIFKNRRTA